LRPSVDPPPGRAASGGGGASAASACSSDSSTTIVIPRLASDHRLRRLLQRLEMMLEQPVARKRVGRADLQMVALDRKEAAGTPPTGR